MSRMKRRDATTTTAEMGNAARKCGLLKARQGYACLATVMANMSRRSCESMLATPMSWKTRSLGCRASTTEEDGTFFVFLEDVDETLMVRYITEGELLGIHCKLSEETPPYFMAMPYCTFKRRDDTSLLRGEKVELTFGLLPTTVLIQGGHRLRVAIAGAARDTFARIPTTGAKSLQVSLRRHLASYIRLPVVS